MPNELPKCARVVVKQLAKADRSNILGGKQVTRIFKITPNTAAKWLEGNTHNRSLKPGDIARYERDMKENNWKTTHQGIAFSPESVLVDGQNRLWAIFNSGCTVRMQVTFNEPLEHQAYVDKVVPRSPYDVLKLAGYEWVRSNVEAGVVNGFARFGYGLHLKLSPNELTAIADKLRDGVIHVMNKIYESQQGRSMLRKVPLIIVLVRGYYSRKIKRQRLDEFIEILASGMINDKSTDTAAIALRDFILKCKDEKDAELRRSMYFRAERALIMFSKMKNLKVLKALYREQLPLMPMDKEIREIIVNLRQTCEANRRSMRGVKPWEPDKAALQAEEEDEEEYEDEEEEEEEE